MDLNHVIFILAGIIVIAFIIGIIIRVKKRSSELEKTLKNEISDKEPVSLKIKLAKTKNFFIGRIADLVSQREKLDEELLEDLEEILIQADLGVKTTLDIIKKLGEKIRDERISNSSEIKQILENIVRELLLKDYSLDSDFFPLLDKKPFVILLAGVNGVGKTTTIGKLAKRFKDKGKSVLLIAADTFRAAAIEQLSIWADRAKASIIKPQPGADPASVVYDGLISAVNKKIDVVLIDTAGRQHTKINLMNELSKMSRTIKKVIPEGPHETLLVVDATTGQNAITQAEMFNEAINLTGLVLAKLDGTSKGGIVIGIKHQLNIPVKLIGVGESLDDLRDFDVEEFVKAIFE